MTSNLKGGITCIVSNEPLQDLAIHKVSFREKLNDFSPKCLFRTMICKCTKVKIPRFKHLQNKEKHPLLNKIL